jgi:hypothetical protein
LNASTKSGKTTSPARLLQPSVGSPFTALSGNSSTDARVFLVHFQIQAHEHIIVRNGLHVLPVTG